jgi:hypothetical protein
MYCYYFTLSHRLTRYFKYGIIEALFQIHINVGAGLESKDRVLFSKQYSITQSNKVRMELVMKLGSLNSGLVNLTG